MSIPKRVTNFNLFVDGKGKAGLAEEVTMPDVVAATEEYQGGGMAAPIDILMGTLEKMDADFTMKGMDADTLKLFGVVEGNDVPLTFRGALHGEGGAVEPMVATMRGVITKVELGSLKVGENTTKFNMNVRYFKLELNGEVIYDIDVMTNTVIINGVDQTADIRSALGL